MDNLTKLFYGMSAVIALIWICTIIYYHFEEKKS